MVVDRETQIRENKERNALRAALSDPYVVGFTEQERYESLKLLFKDDPRRIDSVPLSGAPSTFGHEAMLQVTAGFGNVEKEREFVNAFLAERTKNITGNLPQAPSGAGLEVGELEARVDEIVSAARALPDSARSELLAKIMVKIGTELSQG